MDVCLVQWVYRLNIINALRNQSSGDCPQTRMLFKGFQQTLKESITFSLIAVQHFSSQAVLTHKLEN